MSRPPTGGESPADPRIYLAAERTFLAWIRTGVALLAFGFVVARFGIFLRQATLLGGVAPPGPANGPGVSLAAGLGLVATGVVVCVVSAFRHARHVRAIDAGLFRQSFSSTFGFALVALLALVGVVIAVLLLQA